MSVAAAVLVGVLLSVLASWSLGPLAHFNGRMGTNTYDAEGVVPIAYALFTLGFAVALGALWRRAVPALLIAFAVYVVARAFMDSWLRQRLISAVTATWRSAPPAPAARRSTTRSSSTSSSATRAATLFPAAVMRPGQGASCTHGSARARHRTPRLHDRHVHPREPLLGPAGHRVRPRRRHRRILILAAGWWTHRRIA